MCFRRNCKSLKLNNSRQKKNKECVFHDVIFFPSNVYKIFTVLAISNKLQMIRTFLTRILRCPGETDTCPLPLTDLDGRKLK